MTTETPFTVADLRRWAVYFRTLARHGGNADFSAGVCLSMGVAFDALADGIELCEAPSDPDMQIGKNPSAGSKAWLQGSDHAYGEIGRILRGEKPK